MTSNVGASEISKKSSLGFSGNKTSEYDDACNKYNDALKEKFRPEFLNRIDEIIVFHKLTRVETAKIAEIMLSHLRKRLALMDVELVISDVAMGLIIEKGYDSEYGARPLRRVIQRNIEDVLSEKILRGELAAGAKITVDEKDGEFDFIVG